MISTLVNVASVLAVMSSGTPAAIAVSSNSVSTLSSLPQLNLQRHQLVAQTLPSLQALEQTIHTQVNQYRASKGLPPLKLDSRISKQALAHSQAMANGRVPFSHDGFQQRVKEIARSLAYSRAAENVAYNMGYQNPAQQAVQGWIKSPGHRRNIEGAFDMTGIGIAQNAKGEYYFTQIFIRRR